MRRGDCDDRRELFCVFMARGFSPEEAARGAGYGARDCGRQAARLLGDGRVRRKIGRLSREQCRAPTAVARAGLERLALGDANDALALLEEDGGAWRKADLFHVAELKRPKGGGIEIKFYDRLRALSLLAELDEKEDGTAGSLLAALEQAVRAGGEGDG